jgi:hypothetical protein
MANKKDIMRSIKAARGLDRAAHFEKGGTLVEWMGGPHLIVKDKKKFKNKKACRGQQRY